MSEDNLSDKLSDKLRENLPPIGQRQPSDWLMDLSLRLRALEQAQPDSQTAAIEIWHQTILFSKAELEILQPQQKPTSLFDQDYCAWVREQIRLLHLRQFDQLDTEHLPDELHALVRFIEREIENNLEIICAHLLKFKYAREYLDDEPCCDSWRSTLRRARRQIALDLEESPSLQGYPKTELDFRYELAMDQVYRETKLPDNSLPETCPWDINQILDKDWLPE